MTKKQYYIVRTYSAGVFAGFIKSRNGNNFHKSSENTAAQRIIVEGSGGASG